MGIREKLTGSLTSTKQYVALATIEAKKYQETNLEIIKYLTTDQNTPGVYVTLNKPFNIIKKLFIAKGINAEMIIFIDAVTKTSGGSIER